MQIQPLNANWSVRSRDEKPGYYQPAVAYLGEIPATVPGNVHVDLHSAGVIPDPFGRAYEAGLRWIDNEAWIYRCEFDWAESNHPHHVLRFEGLDTVCTIRLNGAEIARHDNMFVPLEIEVGSFLKLGANVLEVEFESAVRVGDERHTQYLTAENLPIGTPFFDERAFVRKAGYMSGWDWGPRFVSCGIWKPVTLQAFTNRIKRTSVLQERRPDGSFAVKIVAEVEGDAKVGAEFAGQRREPGEALEFVVEDPRLWWPNGEGEAHLYDVLVFLEDGQEVRKRIGLRTVKLLRTPDAIGTSFEFEVNGRPIWCRGANWIPNDSFLGRETDESTTKQIGTCKALQMNMLRVWGGGIYESEAFYDACDEAGILVWQDFPYACSYYPDGPAEVAIASEEARENVLRLRDRTSLALWCGNNENLAMFEGAWGGMENRPPRLYGDNIYLSALPGVLTELDPGRDYIPTSPLLPTDEANSDDHYWDVWHGRGDWTFYTESKSRFASEFGFASSCSMPCWKTILDPSDFDTRSRAVRWHDKTTKPIETFEGYVLKHYPQWQSLEEWTYYSQLNQRDAFRHGIEHYRRSDFCRGALIWQFNDCWPVQSWAVQDYARLLKPAGYELARLYAPAMLSVEIIGDEVRIWLANDAPSDLDAVVELTVVDTLSGESLHADAFSSVMPSGGRGVVLNLDIARFDRMQSALKVVIAGRPDSETWRLFCEPKDLQLKAVELRAEVSGDLLRITVDGFVHDLIVWDESDPTKVLLPSVKKPGHPARSAANSTLEYLLEGEAEQLKARSMAGTHRL